MRIAEILRRERLADVSQPTIARILRDAREAPPAAAPPRVRTARQSTPSVPDQSEPDDVDPIAALEERLREIRAFITESRVAGKITAYKDLVKLEADVAARLLALRPPPPLDPALDPAHRESREALRDALAAFVATLRERAA